MRRAATERGTIPPHAPRWRGGRPVLVEMSRPRGIDVEDLRRGDYVTFAGD